MNLRLVIAGVIIIVCSLIGLCALLVTAPVVPLNESVLQKTQSSTVSTAVTISPEQADLDNLKSKLISEFRYGFYCYSGDCMPPEDLNLSEIAFSNARNGTHSFKAIGKNSDEAFNVYTLYLREKSNAGYHTYGEFSNFVSVYWRQYNYGIGIYKTGNQYNVSVVIRITPDEEVVQTSTGAYQSYQPPDYLKYLWG
jgi:hypothetical protein